MDFIQFISAAGIGGIIGSLLTTVVQARLSNKQQIANRNFQEKKEAYIGFLEAGHRSEAEKTSAASINWGYWKNHCELVASPQVIKMIEKIEATNPIKGEFHPGRPQAMHDLKEAMRKDLNVHLL